MSARLSIRTRPPLSRAMSALPRSSGFAKVVYSRRLSFHQTRLTGENSSTTRTWFADVLMQPLLRDATLDSPSSRELDARIMTQRFSDITVLVSWPRNSG